MEHINKIKFETVSTGKNPLVNALYNETSKGLTENGAVTLIRSASLLLDFYAQAGAMRPRPQEALDLFKKAFAEDKEKAVKILFYLRDVRGGQGERDLFRNCLQWLGTDYPAVFSQIIEHVPEYGRWDDLLFDNDEAFELIGDQLVKDKESESPSLLAKWLPTINASSPTTKAKAKFVANKLGVPDQTYRKVIRDIRKKIATVEEKMSANKWKEINYSAVPSQASRIYKDAFKKHDGVRYSKFVEKAESGEVKINAATLYPYQIYKSVKSNYSRTLEALWNQLPDYTQGKNALVVADVSGSMTGDPMSVSVSLALYFAQRNKGHFKDHFITFSSTPVFQRIVGSDLMSKMNSIEGSDWSMNTDLQAVFNLVLSAAVSNNIAQEDMPDTIYIISDMEFDSACEYRTNLEVIEDKYMACGYKRPNLVFWNVNGRGNNLPAGKDEQGISLVSGFSPVIFKMAVENKNPEQVMLDTINSERYAKIKVQ